VRRVKRSIGHFRAKQGPVDPLWVFGGHTIAHRTSAGKVPFSAAAASCGWCAWTSIWYGRTWVTTIKSTVDGLIYALLTAAISCWLWPR